MEVPADLSAWTYETVLDVVRRYEYEPRRFDFKEALHAAETMSRKWHNDNIQKCVASMANAPFGGFILFGVRDPRADQNVGQVSPEGRIVGIPFGADFRKELAEKLATIQPPPAFELKVVRLPNDLSRCILVVEIPESPVRPHMDPSTHVFYIRSIGGSAEPMSQREVRDQMLYSSHRLQQVLMLRLDLHSFRVLRAALQDPNTWFARFDSQAFKILLAQISDLLPQDGVLLAKLHGIATMATQFNLILDKSDILWRRARFIPKAIPGNPRGALDATMQEQLDAFDDWCQQAQDALAQLFGPLALSNELPPTTSKSDRLPDEGMDPYEQRPQKAE